MDGGPGLKSREVFEAHAIRCILVRSNYSLNQPHLAKIASMARPDLG